MKKIALADFGEFWYGDYKEPFEQLEGAIPGHPVGVLLKDDEGKVLCAYCGKTYENLGSHVNWSHGMTSREYKDAVGLLSKSALLSERLRLTHHAVAKRAGLGHVNAHRLRSDGPRAAGAANGRRKAEFKNKTGTCYAQALAVGRSIVAQKGRLSERELRRHGIYETVVRSYFGDMDGYRRAIGLHALHHVRRWEQAELIEMLKNLAAELARTPTPTDLRRYGLPTGKVWRRAFGSYEAACRASGLDPRLPAYESDYFELRVLVAYATLGSIARVASHLHVDRAKVEAIFHRYGAPFPLHLGIGGLDSSNRREWAADMARRLAGEVVAA